MILHRSLALPRSVLNSTLSNTESTQRKQVFPRWKFTERSRKGILYGYLEDNASWSRLSRARTCSGLITDTKLKPLATRVSMSQILFFSLRFSIFVFQFLSPFPPSFSTEGHTRSLRNEANFKEEIFQFLIETLCVQLIHSDTVCDYNCEISFLLVRGNQCF